MKKLVSALALSIALPCILMAQFTVRGKISDSQTKTTLPNARVSIENSFRETLSDKDGNFIFRNISEGTYQLLVNYIGYKMLIKDIDVKSDLSIDIMLESSITLTDEVVITAIHVDDNSPTTHSNLSKEEIGKVNLGQDLPLLLSTTPSVVVSSDAGTGVGYTNLRIRGTDLNRINITMNGIPLNDAESHGVFWVNMPDFASSIDNIQIQRGVGSSTNGAAAFGASINMQTLKLNATPYAEINSTVGSFNTFKNNVTFGSGLLNEHWTIDGRLSKISSDGFIDRAFSNLKSFYMSGAYYDSKNILRFNILSGKEQTYQAWYGVPKVCLQNDSVGMARYYEHGLYSEEQTKAMLEANSKTYNYYTYPNETDNYQQDHYQLFYSRTLSSHWNFNSALHYTKGRGYYESSYDNKELSSFNLNPVIIGTDTITSTNAITQKWLDNDFYGITFSANYNSNKKLRFTFGGGANRYEGHHFGKIIWAEYASNGTIDKDWYRGTGNKDDANLFVKMNYKLLDSLSVYVDLQGRYIHHVIGGIDDKLRDVSQSHTFNFFNPKVGFNYDLSSMQRVYSSLAVAHREPNRANYVDAPINKQPTDETLYDVEVGYDIRKSKWKASATFYYMYYFNQLIMTGQINDVGAAIMTNVPYSFRRGLELATAIQLHKNIRWNGSVTLSENIIDGHWEYIDNWDTWGQDSSYYKKSAISFSPKLIANSSFNFKLFKGFEASFISQYVSRQYIDNTGAVERSLHPYFTTNMLLNYAFKTKLVRDISISLMVNNLFNTSYEANAWVYRYKMANTEYAMDGYFPQAGVNFLMGVKVRF